MKIKKSITKRVNDTLAETKKVLTNSIIEMLSDMGVEPNASFMLAYPVALNRTKMNKDGRICSETCIVNSVAYMCSNGFDFILCEYNVNKNISSSIFMSVRELIELYEAVKITIKEE